MTLTRTIHLIYWKGQINLGDILSPKLLEEIGENIKTQYCDPRINGTTWLKALFRTFVHIYKFLSRDPIISQYNFLYHDIIRLNPFIKPILAIGSIMEFGYSNCKYWGCGFMRPDSQFKGGHVYAARGLLTKNKLKGKVSNWNNIAIGDPALLLPLWIKPVKEQTEIISIIPHWSEIDIFRKKYGELYNIIDFRTEDIKKIVSEISRSQYILSSSLHGLIISHAYGVPAIWIRETNLGENTATEFKFHDYFSSVNIPLYNGFYNHTEILKSTNNVKAFFIENERLSKINIDLKKLQRSLLKAAPFKIKDKYKI